MARRTILVTGGAGYIGSHTLRALVAAGYCPVVLDDLSAGHRQAVPADVPLVVADLGDPAALGAVFRTHRPAAVVHFAALVEVGMSVLDPRPFFRTNVVHTLTLLDAMAEAGVNLLVFSSSAAVYGEPTRVPIPEDAALAPVNPYGRTKATVEHVLRDYDRAYGLRSISLRYFNACGADPSGEIGEAHPRKTHLIEIALLAALGQRDAIPVFGTDYPTPDGTAIRDYVHVCDLADAHVLALRALEDGAATTAYNVGLGAGFSVTEVLDAADRVTGRPVRRIPSPRRAGDPAVLVADPTRIRAELGWSPGFGDLDLMVATAWRWHSTHPHGFL